jgi:endoglucanase
MFFALVANDRARFDALLGWTERNLARGSLSEHLPAWLWGRAPDNNWRVLDENSASDADLWMAYVLLEAGQSWHNEHYQSLGRTVANRVVETETATLPGFGPVLLPGANGFRHGDSIRLNASYMPLQLFLRLGELLPRGPWREMADRIPALVRQSSPSGFVSDWIEFSPGRGFTPSSTGSYDAIRVYLWAGMLDPATPGRTALLSALSGMAHYVQARGVPPARITSAGQIVDPNGPLGFSAAVVPYLESLGDTTLARAQLSRLKSGRDARTGLYGFPARYYDQNLALFALGATEHCFRFDARGELRTRWSHPYEWLRVDFSRAALP